jgi:hypothetical protein
MIGGPSGKFMRTYWYKQGIEHGNPFYNSRFRVNSPEASVHPEFMYRSEARENGMMQVLINEDLQQLDGAKLYLETWGGHPGTANKRVMINGRSLYPLPEVGTADGNCTHSYPIIPLKITDLVNGYNAIQFACDQGTSFWGHFIIDNACLMTILKDNHPDLDKAGIARSHAFVKADPSYDNGECFKVSLSCSPSVMDAISEVDFWGYYYSYDENGNSEMTDWHGFTKGKRPVGIIGTSTQAPFEILWDVSMIPEQKDIAIMAVLHFKEQENIVYNTPTVNGLQILKEDKVTIYCSKDLPKPFWSRANQKKNCTIELNIQPHKIERAELHVVLWDGGCGNVDSPFILNGHPLSVAGEGRHDVIYRKVALDPKLLRTRNEISLLSDTEHHGIEILSPGPMLVIRSKEIS